MDRRPTRRDDGWPTPGEIAHVVVNMILITIIVISATIGYRALSDAYKSYKISKEAKATVYKPTHDSLQISYTYDPDVQVRWYVFIDPDTQQEYLFNDLGGCTPRLDSDGESVMTSYRPSDSDM